MATKKTEDKKKNTKKTTTKKNNTKKVVEKVAVEEEKEVEEIKVDEEFDDEEEIEVVKENKPKKKTKKKKKVDVLGDSFAKQNEELFSFIKILIALVILIVAFYFIVGYLRGDFKKGKDETEEETTQIQNYEILASKTFTKLDKEYYVLFYNKEGVKSDLYASMYSDYQDKGLDNPIFWVDLGNKFNKDILSEDTNDDAQKYSELKVSEPTLIHIKNGKNVGYFEGEKVQEELVKLLK